MKSLRKHYYCDEIIITLNGVQVKAVTNSQSRLVRVGSVYYEKSVVTQKPLNKNLKIKV